MLLECSDGNCQKPSYLGVLGDSKDVLFWGLKGGLDSCRRDGNCQKTPYLGVLGNSKDIPFWGLRGGLEGCRRILVSVPDIHLNGHISPV